jgi:hypothetical protein
MGDTGADIAGALACVTCHRGCTAAEIEPLAESAHVTWLRTRMPAARGWCPHCHVPHANARGLVVATSAAVPPPARALRTVRVPRGGPGAVVVGPRPVRVQVAGFAAAVTVPSPREPPPPAAADVAGQLGLAECVWAEAAASPSEVRRWVWADGALVATALVAAPEFDGVRVRGLRVPRPCLPAAHELGRWPGAAVVALSNEIQ